MDGTFQDVHTVHTAHTTQVDQEPRDGTTSNYTSDDDEDDVAIRRRTRPRAADYFDDEGPTGTNHTTTKPTAPSPNPGPTPHTTAQPAPRGLRCDEEAAPTRAPSPTHGTICRTSVDPTHRGAVDDTDTNPAPIRALSTTGTTRRTSANLAHRGANPNQPTNKPTTADAAAAIRDDDADNGPTTNLANLDAWLNTDFVTGAAHPAAIAALRSRLPSLEAADVRSFADIVGVARKYLKTNAVATASAHAAAHYATNPRLDLARVATDAARARAMGLLAFLTEKSEALRPVTLQPTDPLEPDPDPSAPSMPPRPPQHTLKNFHDLCNGGRILLPDGFTPDGCPEPKPKPASYALAIEYLQQKDFAAGLSIILPLSDAHELFHAAALPLNGTPNDIVAATDKPMGRLVVDSSRSGINAPDKKEKLTDLYGPIVYPTHVHWCELFAAVRELFPGEPLEMFKADFDRWFKRVRLLPEQAGLLAQPLHINGAPYVVIPLVGQFGCQEFNYMASQASAFIYQRVRARDIATYGGPVRLCLSDDTVGYLPPALYAADDAAFTLIADAHAGKNAAPATKKSINKLQTAVGALYDLTDMRQPRIGVSEALYLKLICVFFLELPQTLVARQTRVRVKQIQRIGSYMHLTSIFVPRVLPYAHAVYENIQGVPYHQTHVALSQRAIVDITYWRATLFATTLSPAWLEVPLHIPPLVHRPRDTDPVAFAHGQAARADVIIGTDAATNESGARTWGGGWTAHPRRADGDTTPTAYGEYQLPNFSAFLNSGALSPDELERGDHINLYEAVTVLFACDAVLNNWADVVGTPTAPGAHRHLHVWCDNTVAISWLTRYKNHHPLVNYVLQVWSRLQDVHHCTITMGHIPGVQNIVPDAISRQFAVSDGSTIKAALSQTTRHTSLPSWWQNLLTCSTAQSDVPSRTARLALTALGHGL